MPSRRRQISATASTSPPGSKLGSTARARSTNSADAVEPGPTSSDGTGHAHSPATPSDSRLVASTVTSGHCASSRSTSGTAASSTCSQLSSTNEQLSRTERLDETVEPAAIRFRRDGKDRRDCLVTSAASRIGANSTNHAPSRYSPNAAAAACSARLVFPTPPTPTSVTRRCARSASRTAVICASRPRKLVVGRRKIAGCRIHRPQRRELDPQPLRAHLKYRDRRRQVAQPEGTEVDAIEIIDQRGRRRRNQDLAAMTGRHDASRTVQCRAEIVVTALLGLTGRDPHAHRQRERRCATIAASTAARGDGTPRTRRRRCA